MSQYRLQRGSNWEYCSGKVVGVTETDLLVEDAEGIPASIPLATLQGWATPGEVPNPQEG